MSQLHPWEIYAKELLTCGYGYPMWCPEPSPRHGEVQLGDVGYLWNGHFNLLFNCMRQASDPRNSRGVPEGFSVFEPPNGDTGTPYLNEVPLELLREEAQRRAFGMHASVEDPTGEAKVGGKVRYRWRKKTGAFLRLKRPGNETLLECTGYIGQYMAQHIENWHAFASTRSITELRRQDILFISGFMKTPVWEVVAFRHKSSSAIVGINGGMFTPVGSVSGGTDVSLSDCVKPATFRRHGPLDRISAWDENEPAVNIYDQCIFLDYVHIKSRLWTLRVHRLRGGAVPRELTASGSEESVVEDVGVMLNDELQWSNNLLIEEKVSGYRSTELSASDDDAQVPDGLLDYILERSTADFACASARDISRLFRGRDFPDDLPAALNKLNPSVDIDDNNIGIIAWHTNDRRRPSSPLHAEMRQTPSYAREPRGRTRSRTRSLLSPPLSPVIRASVRSSSRSASMRSLSKPYARRSSPPRSRSAPPLAWPFSLRSSTSVRQRSRSPPRVWDTGLGATRSSRSRDRIRPRMKIPYPRAAVVSPVDMPTWRSPSSWRSGSRGSQRSRKRWPSSRDLAPLVDETHLKPSPWLPDPRPVVMSPPIIIPPVQLSRHSTTTSLPIDIHPRSDLPAPISLALPDRAFIAPAQLAGSIVLEQAIDNMAVVDKGALLQAWDELSVGSAEVALANRPGLVEFAEKHCLLFAAIRSPVKVRLPASARLDGLGLPDYTAIIRKDTVILPEDTVAFYTTLHAEHGARVVEHSFSTPFFGSSRPGHAASWAPPSPPSPNDLNSRTVMEWKTIGLVYVVKSTLPQEVCIGVALLPEHRGHGCALRACASAVQWAVETSHAHRIEARILSPLHHQRARRLFSLLGFVKEGVQRSALQNTVGSWTDVTCMTVLDTEWADGARLRAVPQSVWDDLLQRQRRERTALLRGDLDDLSDQSSAQYQGPPTKAVRIVHPSTTLPHDHEAKSWRRFRLRIPSLNMGFWRRPRRKDDETVHPEQSIGTARPAEVLSV